MNRLHDHTPRLNHWVYSHGAYFVTFKVEARRPALGAVDAGRCLLSTAGLIVERAWQTLPREFPVELDSHVIMPDHVHAVLMLQSESAHTLGRESGFQPLMRERAVTLGKVIRAWKARSTIEIRRSVDPAFAWQSRYFERVIRHPQELERVRTYILANPLRWSGRTDRSP